MTPRKLRLNKGFLNTGDSEHAESQGQVSHRVDTVRRGRGHDASTQNS